MNKRELIDLVFSTPSIWNKQHKQHHNRHVLAREWTKIATQIGVTEKEARNCWKNLRQEFGKQLKKTQVHSDDAESDENECIWPYFKKLLFLRDQFPPRSLSSNKSNKILTLDNLQVDVNSDVSGESDLEHSTVSSFVNVFSPHPEGQTSNTPPTPTPSTSDSKYSVSQMGYKKRKTEQIETGKLLMDLEKDTLALEVNKIRQDSSDEDVGFFNSLLPHVRKLTPRDKFKFRMKTQQILFEMLFPPTAPASEEIIHKTEFSFSST